MDSYATRAVVIGCLVIAIMGYVAAQRPGYAGRRPIGYPVMEVSTEDGLSNKFGDDDTSGTTTTTQRLPLEALGDRDLVERLMKLPRDRWPFWLLNWEALELNRQNGQTYPLRPSPFNTKGNWQASQNQWRNWRQ